MISQKPNISKYSQSNESVNSLSDTPEQENSVLSSISEKSVDLESIKEETEDEFQSENSVHSLDANDIKETEFNGKTRSKSNSFKIARQSENSQLKGNIKHRYQQDIIREVKKQNNSKGGDGYFENLKETKSIKTRLKKVLTVNTQIKQKLGVILEADCEESAIPQALKKGKPSQDIKPSKQKLAISLQKIKMIAGSEKFQFLYLIVFIIGLCLTQLMLYLYTEI